MPCRSTKTNLSKARFTFILVPELHRLDVLSGGKERNTVVTLFIIIKNAFYYYFKKSFHYLLLF